MSHQMIALLMGLAPIVLFGLIYAIHLVRVASGEVEADSSAHPADRAEEVNSLNEELRGVRLELRALREALEQGNNCRH